MKTGILGESAQKIGIQPRRLVVNELDTLDETALTPTEVSEAEDEGLAAYRVEMHGSVAMLVSPKKQRVFVEGEKLLQPSKEHRLNAKRAAALERSRSAPTLAQRLANAAPSTAEEAVALADFETGLTLPEEITLDASIKGAAATPGGTHRPTRFTPSNSCLFDVAINPMQITPARSPSRAVVSQVKATLARAEGACNRTLAQPASLPALVRAHSVYSSAIVQQLTPDGVRSHLQFKRSASPLRKPRQTLPGEVAVPCASRTLVERLPVPLADLALSSPQDLLREGVDKAFVAAARDGIARLEHRNDHLHAVSAYMQARRDSPDKATRRALVAPHSPLKAEGPQLVRTDVFCISLESEGSDADSPTATPDVLMDTKTQLTSTIESQKIALAKQGRKEERLKRVQSAQARLLDLKISACERGRFEAKHIIREAFPEAFQFVPPPFRPASAVVARPSASRAASPRRSLSRVSSTPAVAARPALWEPSPSRPKPQATRPTTACSRPAARSGPPVLARPFTAMCRLSSQRGLPGTAVPAVETARLLDDLEQGISRLHAMNLPAKHATGPGCTGPLTSGGQSNSVQRLAAALPSLSDDAPTVLSERSSSPGRIGFFAEGVERKLFHPVFEPWYDIPLTEFDSKVRELKVVTTSNISRIVDRTDLPRPRLDKEKMRKAGRRFQSRSGVIPTAEEIAQIRARIKPVTGPASRPNSALYLKIPDTQDTRAMAAMRSRARLLSADVLANVAPSSQSRLNRVESALRLKREREREMEYRPPSPSTDNAPPPSPPRYVSPFEPLPIPAIPITGPTSPGALLSRVSDGSKLSGEGGAPLSSTAPMTDELMLSKLRETKEIADELITAVVSEARVVFPSTDTGLSCDEAALAMLSNHGSAAPLLPFFNKVYGKDGLRVHMKR